MDVYELLRGPGAWIAFSICIIGSVGRLGLLMSRARKINRMHPGKSLQGGILSMVRGLLPWGLQAHRQQPLFSMTAFIFHLCVLITPLFLLAHIVLVYESWQIQWMSLPDTAGDILTVLVLAGIVYFSIRRLVRKEVRSLSTGSDWALLAVIAATFLTGFLSFHHWTPYRPTLILHIGLGELFLIMIPFSKLIHMVLFFFTRGYLGAEYEIVMKGEGL